MGDRSLARGLKTPPFVFEGDVGWCVGFYGLGGALFDTRWVESSRDGRMKTAEWEDEFSVTEEGVYG